MPLECPKPECTVLTTGICFLNNGPDNCPVRLGEQLPAGEVRAESAKPPEIVPTDDPGVQAVVVEDAVASLPERSVTHFQFRQGSVLGSATLETLRRKRRVQLISVLGLPNAGKTASLVSLYLLSAAGKLDRFEFRNSNTLMALELLTRGARVWDPDRTKQQQLTERTELQDPRRPGFIHLRLHQKAKSRDVDVAFSDLPGEWTESLIERSDSDRLAFTRTADAVWIMIDGAQLSSAAEGAALVHSTRLLLSRIATLLAPRPGTPIVLVASRRDVAGDLPADRIAKIEGEAAKHGLNFSITQIASFSDDLENTLPGAGLVELLERSLIEAEAAEAARSAIPRSSDREMMNYRADKTA